MGNTSAVVAITAVVVVALAAAMMLGLGGVRVSETEFAGPAPVPELLADDSYGIVLHTSESRGGFSLFGWDLISPKHRAHVAVVPPPGCEVDYAEPVRAEGPCAGIVAEGDVSGDGRTATGIDYVIISVAISETCRDSLAGNDRWPSSSPACVD